MKKRNFVALLGVCLGLAASGVLLAGCGETENVIEHGEWEIVVAPTCESAGLAKRLGLLSEDLPETRSIPATGHEWSEWTTLTEPTCITDGVETRTCNTCGNSDYRAIPAHDHAWGEWEIGTAPTCLSQGYEFRVCIYNETHIETRALEALGHDWSEWTVDVLPTCTQTGTEKRYCVNDNAHMQLRATEACGHDWNEFVVTKAPTCTEEGEKTRTCKNGCGCVETENVSALGHDWGEWVTEKAPSASGRGVVLRYCTNDSTHCETRYLQPVGSAELRYALNEDGTAYSVTLPSALRSSVEELYIPATHEGLPVTEIEDGAFANCLYLKKVEFVGSYSNGTQNYKALLKIGRNAFLHCSMLTRLVIPSSVKEIGDNAFAFTPIGTFQIPESTEIIGASAFGNWGEEQEIFVEGVADEETADACWGRAWRDDCNASIRYDDGTDEYGDILTFSLFNDSSEYKVSLRRKSFSGTVVIPSAYRGIPVTAIADNAFVDCIGLERVVVLGNNLKRIGNNAFAHCENLKEIVISESVTYIGTRAFSNCNALVRVEIPESVNGMGYDVFYGWTQEQTVVVKGFASEGEADAAWKCSSWRNGCFAEIIYEE